jgi:hypothetical protein
VDPTDQGEEDVCKNVGAMAERNTSPPPATEDAVSEGAQQQTGTVELQMSIGEVQGPPPATAVVVEQPEERVEEPSVEDGAASEAGIVDIASILGAPTVTLVQSTL